MLFNVERDAGDEIVGYLVPDTFTGQCSLAVIRGGIEILRVETRQPRPALVSAGRHGSGLCGFLITEADLPGLADIHDLELRDVETGVTIYRRYEPGQMIGKKIFRLETHILPLSNLDSVLQPYFQFYFPNIDRFGMETTHQMFLMNSTESVFASGRVSYKSVEYYLDKGYGSIALLQDPYQELAERVLTLRAIGQGGMNHLGMRDTLAFEAGVAFASKLDLASDRDLKRAFRQLDPSEVGVLCNPLVRQLTKRTPDEALTPSSVGGALDVLSTFAVVGLRDLADLFVEAVAAHLSLGTAALPIVPQSIAVTELGARLRTIPQVERVVEYDLALHHFVADAFEKSLTAA